MKHGCSISALPMSRDWCCTRIIRHIHHKANSIGSGHTSEEAHLGGSRLSPGRRSIRCRRRCSSHYRVSQCQDRTGQTHQPARSQLDEDHRRRGDRRSPKRRATRGLRQTLLQPRPAVRAARRGGIFADHADQARLVETPVALHRSQATMGTRSCGLATMIPHDPKPL